MVQKRFETQLEEDRSRRLTRGLRAVLWAVWTLAVAIAGYMGWRADTLAGRPLNILGMAISASMVGAIGLIVLTLIEMRVEPRSFLD